MNRKISIAIVAEDRAMTRGLRLDAAEPDRRRRAVPRRAQIHRSKAAPVPAPKSSSRCPKSFHELGHPSSNWREFERRRRNLRANRVFSPFLSFQILISNHFNERVEISLTSQSRICSRSLRSGRVTIVFFVFFFFFFLFFFLS